MTLCILLILQFGTQWHGLPCDLNSLTHLRRAFDFHIVQPFFLLWWLNWKPPSSLHAGPEIGGIWNICFWCSHWEAQSGLPLVSIRSFLLILAVFFFLTKPFKSCVSFCLFVFANDNHFVLKLLYNYDRVLKCSDFY